MADGTVKIGTELDESGLKKGLSGLGNFAKSGFSAMGGAAKAFAGASVAAIGMVSGSLAAAGGAAIAVGKEFETSFAKASTLFGDVNVDTENLKQRMLEVSNATGIAASELNESLYSALSAGIPVTEDMAEATAFLESSAKLAKAGFTDMDTALSATAKTLNAYGLDTSEADRIQKILIQTQNKGITTVDELGASLSQVTPTAAAFGVSFENVGAALSNMTAAGTPTAQATTQLNALIAELGKNGTQGAKALKEAAKGTKYAGMGFSEMMDAGVPLNEVLDMLQASADQSGLSMVDMFSSIEAGKAALAMSGENSAKFAENLEAMGTSADVVTEAYDKVTNTLDAKVDKIINSTKNLGIDIFNSIQEPLKGLADTGIGYMDELSEALKTGGVTSFVEAGARILSDIAIGIAEQLPLLIETATSVLTIFIQGLFDNLPQLMLAGGQILSSLVTGVTSLLGQLLPLGGSIIKAMVTGLISSMPAISSKANDIILSIGSGITNGLPQVISLGMELINSLATGIANVLPTLIPVAVEAVFTLVDGLLSNIGTLVDAGISILMGVADGIINTIPVIIEQAPQIINRLCTAFVENLPKIVAAGVEMLVKLAAGIIQAIPTLVSNLPQIFTAIVNAFKTFNFVSIGKNIIEGIKTGVANAAGLLIDSVKDVAQRALDGLKKFLGIHSPSRVMRDEVGKNIALGIADGIEKNAKYAKKKTEEIADLILQTAKDKLDTAKVYNELTLADEVAFWDETRRQVKEGTKARIDADKQYFQAKKSLNQKMSTAEQTYADKVKKVYDDLDKSIKSLWADYNGELASRTKDIMGSMGLFDEFSAKTELTTSDLLHNLQSQVTGLRDWSKNLKSLEKRGVKGQMLEDLRGMGVDAAGEIALLSEMTDDELNDYIRLWKQKQNLARKEASKELAPLLQETQNQITQMRLQADRELTEYKKQYIDTMAEIGVEIQKPLDQIQTSMMSVISEAVKMAASVLSTESGKGENVTQFAKLSGYIIGATASLPSDFASLGIDTVAGMITGLQSKSGDLYAAMSSIIKQTVQAAKDEAQIHSPSRLMRDLIGKNMIAGVGVGFELESSNLEKSARQVIADTSKAMQKDLAKNFVMGMQSGSMQRNITSEISYYAQVSDAGGKAETGNPLIDYKRMGKEMSKAMDGTVVEIDGKKTGKIVTPYANKELNDDGSIRERDA